MALASGIISQQVSGAAAASIKRRFVALFEEDARGAAEKDQGSGPQQPRDAFFPSPAQVWAQEPAVLRTAGLSQRKAEYIYGLAGAFVDGTLSAQKLLTLPDEELVAALTSIRGLGRWSAEMFALFGLKRLDVFSSGDLGVQRGMAAFVGRDVARLKAARGGKWKYMGEREMVEMAERFRPYRSLFTWYMWRVEEVDVSAQEG
jgi:DNA-3-methyladenine glycosylase II